MFQPKILISEDHSLAQQALAATLKSLGYTEVFTATNNEEALELAQQESGFDILICTITAPSTASLALLRDIQKHAHVHSLLLIHETPSDLRIATREFARHCGYAILGELRKPYTKNEMQAALSNHCAKQSHNPGKATTDPFPAKAVANAVRENQFIPYYQPKINLQTMEIVGAEILMRWNHPSLGILGPNSFIDVAKRFGHIDAMTLNILEQALDFANAQNLGEKFKIAVNIDAMQICNPDFHKKIKALLDTKSFCANNLILEITECSALRAPSDCLFNLIQLRLLGCEISIDDFGAGMSSLQRVCELPCTEVKLDMSFAKSLPYNHRTKLAITHMAQFSQDINVRLVAEGIETEEQLQALRKMGCHIGQGYLFSPPVNAKTLLKWLKHYKTTHALKKNS
jgi:EAL domain-containing protein (putative c-di-GMP-specific phosphodiesterase class I)/CheY-like chemotaxis protein